MWDGKYFAEKKLKVFTVSYCVLYCYVEIT